MRYSYGGTWSSQNLELAKSLVPVHKSQSKVYPFSGAMKSDYIQTQTSFDRYKVRLYLRIPLRGTEFHCVRNVHKI